MERLQGLNHEEQIACLIAERALGAVAHQYTMNGRPLTRRGDDLFTRSGNHIGRVQGEKVFGPDGRYVGTLVGDRLVYRSTDSAHVSSEFGRQAGAA